jgi:MFS transporter, MHS family, proline/betaine transporter
MYMYFKKNAHFLRVIGSSSIGTILEWYDFSLFAFLTPLLATYFFPPQDKATGLVLTYAIFALGFFVRPLGAVILGHLGDRIGRKKTLIASILLMAVPTVLIGLLPTYQTIGMLAPILLMLLRICQGLSAGGESVGAALFVMESGKYKYRGTLGAVVLAVIGVGLLAGSYAANLVIAHPAYSWAWRVPFLMGIFTGLIGYFVRRRIPETLDFQNPLRVTMRFPLLHGLVAHRTEIFRILGFYCLSAMMSYLVFIFMPAYATKNTGLPLEQVTKVGTIGLALVTFLLPLGGYLSDCIGRKKCLRWSSFSILILSYPLCWLITSGSMKNLIFAESIFVLLAVSYQGTVTTAIMEQLPRTVRYSVMAVCYNIANSIFGGLSPIIANYAALVTGDKAGLGFCLMLGGGMAFVATIKMRETYRLAF